jgi:hypothetical protein
MKIEEICNSIIRTLDSAMIKENKKPNIRIYMDYDYWHECCNEISGEVNQEAYDFFHSNTVMGYEVWRVVSDNNGKRHIPFKVVVL